MVGLFSWPENKLLAKYSMNTGPAKRRNRINAELTTQIFPHPLNKKKREKTEKHTVGLFVYPERDKSLRMLGIKSYAYYLRCKIWQDIKSCLLSGNRQCVVCGESANVLHHMDYSYATMRGNNPGGLIQLCQSCHYKIEFDDNDNKIFSLSMVNARLEKFRNGT